jgi:DNA modification methylase
VDAKAQDVLSGRGVAGVDAIVTSPPYADLSVRTGAEGFIPGLGEGAGRWLQRRSPESIANHLTGGRYGETAGQIGRLKGGPGTPEGASMPEVETISWKGCYAERWADLLVPEAMAHPAKFAPGLLARIYDHGLARGWWRPGDQIGDPFAGVGCGGVLAAYKGLRWLGVELEERFVGLARRNFELHRRRWEAAGDPVPVIVQGDSRRFAEVVRGAAGLVTSPPWEAVTQGTAGSFREMRAAWNADPANAGKPGWNPRQTGSYCCAGDADSYGDSEGQIGRDSGETYWQAVRVVYAQCLLALRPGGVMCVVVKDYVRDRARVPLCDQTLRLLLSLGFEPVERIRAWLVEERREAGLFGEVVTRKSRASFFRRLATKRGAPPIDFETVLVVRKPPAPKAP